MRNPLAALAGKKARVLYRSPDKSTVLHVEDEHDEILVIVADDGSMSEHRVSGLAGVGAALKAASPFDKMRIPDDAGRKHWARLDEPSAPPPVSAAVESAARTLAIQVHEGRGGRQAEFFPHGIPAGAEAWIDYAVARQWVFEDADGVLRAGPVSPHLAVPEPEPEPESVTAPDRDRLPRTESVQSSSVDTMTVNAAQQLAKTVWGWVGEGLDRAQHFAGIRPEVTQGRLDYAVEQGWVIVDGSQIRRGAVDPRPPAESTPLTGLKARMRWGPDWIG